ncbi:MAG: endonuclease V [Nanoarchaeota archaeon]|nr:endonuclease V [Nanoarchaeota archaeon]
MDKEEIAKKYNIDLEKLKAEQEKLYKTLSLKDSVNFDEISYVGGCFNVFHENKIISGIVVFDVSQEELEVIEEKYHSDKLRFPYISGFRAYREMEAMINCFHSLEKRPELMFINGHGAAHVLGLASHFSLSTNIPCVGIADENLDAEIKKEDMLIDGKKVGKVVLTKENSKPVYVSPGNNISVDSAVEMTKKFVVKPHKLPFPLRAAQRYVKGVRGELFR